MFGLVATSSKMLKSSRARFSKKSFSEQMRRSLSAKLYGMAALV